MGKKFTIIFGGDTCLGEEDMKTNARYELLNRVKKDPMSFYEGIKPLVEGADHLILNLETALAKNPKPLLEGKKYLKCDDPKRAIKTLKKLGATAVSLNNNHVMDFGEDILKTMMKKLQRKKLPYFGAGINAKRANKPYKIKLQGANGKKNLYLLHGMQAGKRYREYGYFASKDSIGVSKLNTKRILKQMEKIKESDPESMIIVIPHWQGIDYKWAEDYPKIREMVREFIDKGANFVLSHGPHMINGVEVYNKGTIAYSMGNFIFNTGGQYKKKGVPPYGLVAKLEIEENGNQWDSKISFYPILIDNKQTNYQTRPINPIEAKELEKTLKIKAYENSFESSYNFYQEKDTPFFQVQEDHNIKLQKPNVHDRTQKDLNAMLVAEELNKQNYEIQWVNHSFFTTNIKGEKIGFDSAITIDTGNVAMKILQKSDVVQEILEEEGYSKESVKRNLEEQYEDVQHCRFLVVKDKCIAVLEKKRSYIVGNGRDTVEGLIQKTNEEFNENIYLKDKIINMDRDLVEFLEKQNLSLSHIPVEDEQIFLNKRNRLVDTTDSIHPSYKRLAEKATRLIQGLSVTGIDMTIKDTTKEADIHDYAIINMDYNPEIYLHHYPTEGQSRNVAGEIIESIKTSIEKAQLKNQQRRRNKGREEGVQRELPKEMKPNSYASPGEKKVKAIATAKLVAREFEKKGYRVKWITKSLFLVKIKEIYVGYHITYSTNTSQIAVNILKDKSLAKEFFKEKEISVAKGKIFDLYEKDEAKEYFKSFQTPVVVKPTDGNKGRGISVGVEGEVAFEKAFDEAKNVAKQGIIIEEQFINGTEARYVVIDGQCKAVIKRIPPSVTGDGIQTIEELIDEKNKARSLNPNLANKLIKLNDHRLSIIEKQGYSLSSIPKQGVRVMIDWKGGLSSGADSMDITDVVHPSYKELAEKASKAIPGIDIAGIDILAKDHTQPVKAEDYIIVEGNASPGIVGHHYPLYGTPRNVAGEIAEHNIKKVERMNSHQE